MNPDPHEAASQRRVLSLWCMLAVSSITDLILTLVAAQSMPGFDELNPVGAHLLQFGLLAPILAKSASLALSLACCMLLARNGQARIAERSLVAWSVFYACLNTASIVMLLGVT